MVPTLPTRCNDCGFDAVIVARRELDGQDVDIEELTYEIRPTWCGLSLCSDLSDRCLERHEYSCRQCYAGPHDLRDGYSFSPSARFVGIDARGRRCERCGLGFRAGSVAERLPARYGCTGEAMSTPSARRIEEHRYQTNALDIASDMLVREAREPDERA